MPIYKSFFRSVVFFSKIKILFFTNSPKQIYLSLSVCGANGIKKSKVQRKLGANVVVEVKEVIWKKLTRREI